jgi:hypothetical protein
MGVTGGVSRGRIGKTEPQSVNGIRNRSFVIGIFLLETDYDNEARWGLFF